MSDVNEIYDFKGDLIAISGNSEYRKPELVSDNPLSAFARGAYSFPLDWWVAIHWANGLNGLYGPSRREEARRIGRTLDVMFSMAVSAAPVTFKISSVVMKYIISSEFTGHVPLDKVLKRIDRKQFVLGSANVAAGFAGRQAGGLFTNYAASGGRAGARRAPRGTKLKKAGKVGNAGLASIGSLIKLAAMTRGSNVTVVDMVVALLSGQAQTSFSAELWKDLYIEVVNSELDFNKTEEEAFYKIFNDIKTYVDSTRRESSNGR